MAPSAIHQIKELIQAGEPITERTRDLLLFNAVVDIYEQVQDTQNQLRPLIQFYKAALWIGGIIVTGLITMAMSGTIQVTIK